METLTTLEAATQLGVNVQKFHRLADRHDIRPILKAPGLRGAKFWKASDVRRLASKVAA